MILGSVNIRHCLNEDLLFRGGHIGYGIRPTQRKNGYATLMLGLALEKSRLAIKLQAESNRHTND
jgi:predicted acetyltransferase